jgi:hypothetical protein
VIHLVGSHESLGRIQQGTGLDLHTCSPGISILNAENRWIESEVDLSSIKVFHIFDPDRNLGNLSWSHGHIRWFQADDGDGFRTGWSRQAS